MTIQFNAPSVIEPLGKFPLNNEDQSLVLQTSGIYRLTADVPWTYSTDGGVTWLMAASGVPAPFTVTGSPITVHAKQTDPSHVVELAVTFQLSGVDANGNVSGLPTDGTDGEVLTKVAGVPAWAPAASPWDAEVVASEDATFSGGDRTNDSALHIVIPNGEVWEVEAGLLLSCPVASGSFTLSVTGIYGGNAHSRGLVLSPYDSPTSVLCGGDEPAALTTPNHTDQIPALYSVKALVIGSGQAFTIALSGSSSAITRVKGSFLRGKKKA